MQVAHESSTYCKSCGGGKGTDKERHELAPISVARRDILILDTSKVKYFIMSRKRQPLPLPTGLCVEQ